MQRTLAIHQDMPRQGEVSATSKGWLHLLLLGNAHGLAAAASGLGVLTPHTQTPVVAQTTVVPDLLQALQVITDGRVNARGGQLQGQGSYR